MKLHRFIAAIAALLILPILSLPVFAVGASGTLNLRCSTHVDGERRYFVGDEFSLVKIADAEVTTSGGKAIVQYTVLPRYKELDCNWQGLSAEESHAKAMKLASMVTGADEYHTSAVTDLEGSVSFSDLDEALYLVVRTKAGPQNQLVCADPFLVSVPLLWEGNLVHTVTASPKYGWTPQEPSKPVPTDPQLPQTGQLKWPVPVLGGLGAFFILIGLRMYRKK